MNYQHLPKNGLLLLTVFSLAITLCFTYSCKKEDQQTWSKTLIGTWDVNELTYFIDGEEKVYTSDYIDSAGIVRTYIFIEDSTLKLISNVIPSPNDTIYGEWTVSGDTIVASIIVSGVWRLSIYKYSIEENILNLSWGLNPDFLHHGKWIRRN